MTNQCLLVLGWHNVEGSWCFPSHPGSGTRGMEQQFRALKRSANVVPLGRALQALAEGRPLPPRSVAITFDDGYRDTLEIAAGMLERLELPSTVFLVPGILSGDVNPWWELLAWAFTKGRATAIEWEAQRVSLPDARSRRRAFKLVSEQLKRRDRHHREKATGELVSLLDPPGTYHAEELFLDWDGARELSRTMAIGSHSMYHAILSEEAPEAQCEDLSESRRQLEKELAVEVGLFAYPNGAAHDFDAATITAAEAAGYAHSVTTMGGWNRPGTPPHEIRRWVVYPERGAAGLGVIPRDLVKAALGRPRLRDAKACRLEDPVSGPKSTPW